MSAADDIRDTLRTALDAAYAPVRTAGAAYAQALKAAMATADIEETMSAAIGVIVAAEELKEAAETAEKSARNALATTFQDTGAPEAVTMHHKAYLSRKPAFVSVDQPDLLPENFWKAPIPDRKSIKEAIESGQDVPGCTLIRPNEWTLSIRARK